MHHERQRQDNGGNSPNKERTHDNPRCADFAAGKLSGWRGPTPQIAMW